jgi:hypothetical protein
MIKVTRRPVEEVNAAAALKPIEDAAFMPECGVGLQAEGWIE